MPKVKHFGARLLTVLLWVGFVAAVPLIRTLDIVP
jgi:hypothetical protein